METIDILAAISGVIIVVAILQFFTTRIRYAYRRSKFKIIQQQIQQYKEYDEEYDEEYISYDDECILEEYSQAYYTSTILTETELNFYRQLYPLVEKYGYNINCKTRLADIFQIADTSHKMHYLNMVMSKHIDFLITNFNSEPILAIELDDYTHNFKEAEKNDTFKNQIFRACNLKLTRVPVAQYYDLNGIEETLKRMKTN